MLRSSVVGCPRRRSTSRRDGRSGERSIKSRHHSVVRFTTLVASEIVCGASLTGSQVSSVLLVGQTLGPLFSLIKLSSALLVGRAFWVPSCWWSGKDLYLSFLRPSKSLPCWSSVLFVSADSPFPDYHVGAALDAWG